MRFLAFLINFSISYHLSTCSGNEGLAAILDSMGTIRYPDITQKFTSEHPGNVLLESIFFLLDLNLKKPVEIQQPKLSCVYKIPKYNMKSQFFMKLDGVGTLWGNVNATLINDPIRVIISGGCDRRVQTNGTEIEVKFDFKSYTAEFRVKGGTAAGNQDAVGPAKRVINTYIIKHLPFMVARGGPHVTIKDVHKILGDGKGSIQPATGNTGDKTDNVHGIGNTIKAAAETMATTETVGTTGANTAAVQAKVDTIMTTAETVGTTGAKTAAVQAKVDTIMTTAETTLKTTTETPIKTTTETAGTIGGKTTIVQAIVDTNKAATEGNDWNYVNDFDKTG